jgi:uncharacterized cupredoxin-like copper-binding protein
VLLLLPTAALLLVTAAACGGSSNKTSSSTGGANTAAKPSTTAVAVAAKDVNVTLTDNKFQPNSFAIPSGQDVTIHLKNTGAAIHNMHIFSKDAEGKDFMSAQMINPGESSDLTVHFTKKGTYKFQCDFHTPDMVGTLTAQ